MKKIRLLKNWETFQAGDIVEVESDVALTLIQEKTAEFPAAPAPEAPAAPAPVYSAEQLSTAVETAVSKSLEAFKNSNPHFTTKEAAADKPYKHFGEQLADVKAAMTTGDGVARERLAKVKVASGYNELIDADGGFLVDQDFETTLEQRVMETGLLVGKTGVREVSGNGLKWNDLNDYNRTDGNRPVTVYWTPEAGDATKSKAVIQRQSLELEKLTGLYYATDEILEDSVGLEGEVTDWFGSEFGFKLDDAIFRGTGAGQPLGIVNSPCLVTQAKESAQTADTVNATNCVKMFARMPAAYLAGAEWYINADVFPQLPLMTIGDQPVFLPPNGLIDAPAGMLLGRKINIIEQSATLGDAGDIMFANLKAYKLIRKGGIKSAMSIHVRFVQGESTFRFSVRVNGQPSWRTYRTPAQGSNTTSPFVILAARA